MCGTPAYLRTAGSLLSRPSSVHDSMIFHAPDGSRYPAAQALCSAADRAVPGHISEAGRALAFPFVNP